MRPREKKVPKNGPTPYGGRPIFRKRRHPANPGAWGCGSIQESGSRARGHGISRRRRLLFRENGASREWGKKMICNAATLEKEFILINSPPIMRFDMEGPNIPKEFIIFINTINPQNDIWVMGAK
jgi:hypothetical protein